MRKMDFLMADGPVPFVKNDQGGLSTYLCFLSGDQVASLYDQFGPDLFTRSTRGVLPVRFGWRRSLVETIDNHPDLFQAFNKGIVLAASSVGLSKEEGHPAGIQKLSDISVIDGAQTIGALFYAQKQRHSDVSKVVVPVKVLSGRYVGHNSVLLTDISVHLNTSDPHRSSRDLFGFSPFAQSIASLSISTPSPTNGTFWFFEKYTKSFGEYLRYHSIGKSYRERRAFLSLFPSNQRTTIADLANLSLSWDGRSFVCMRGSLIACREYFSAVDCEANVSERFFKEFVAKVILFQAFRKIKRNSSKEYLPIGLFFVAMAYLNFASRHRLNLTSIWEMQMTTPDLDNVLQRIVSIIREHIVSAEQSSSMRSMNLWLRSADKLDKLLSSPVPRDLSESLQTFLSAAD